MDFEQGKVYHGFKLLEEQKIEELNSIGKVFYHEKSGARLFSLANDDDNKVFFIGFRHHRRMIQTSYLEHLGSLQFTKLQSFCRVIRVLLTPFKCYDISDKHYIRLPAEISRICTI